MQRLADQSLAHLGPIRVGRVEKIDPEFAGSVQHPLCFLFVGGLAPHALARDAHGAEPQAIDCEFTADFEAAGSCCGC